MENVPATVEQRAIRPADEVAFATEAAKVLVDIVKKGKLSKKLGGDKEHIMYEGWATVAKFYGCTIKTKSVTPTFPLAGLMRRSVAAFFNHQTWEATCGTLLSMRYARRW